MSKTRSAAYPARRSTTHSTSVTITAGQFRGRRLTTPDTAATHPMGSREKLALFNSLSSLGVDFTPSLRVLDLFAGSGALGLEALSRGAGSVVFADHNTKARAAIRQNLETIYGEERPDTLLIPKIPQSPAEYGTFGLILADPPYDDFPTNLAFLSSLLTPDGLLALSHPANVAPEALFPDLTFLSTKSHAASRLSFFRKHKD